MIFDIEKIRIDFLMFLFLMDPNNKNSKLIKKLSSRLKIT